MDRIFKNSVVVMVLLLAVASSVSYADRGRLDKGIIRDMSDDLHRSAPPKSDPNFRLDRRFDHNRTYPREGVIYNTIPKRRPPIRYHDRSYFYFGGTWYLPSGPNYVVVKPPIGIIVSVLPPFYTTLWIGGIPYYYANDVYYVWRPDLNGYEVTEPPLEEGAKPPPLVADELYIYPKEGQSKEKQAEDRYACHRWAVEESKYDPTEPPSNLPVNTLSRMREDYQRAMKACLEGRGYSVR